MSPSDYLAPTPLWAWDHAGQVALWPDGQAIAFRQEIEQILRASASRGLPPFSPVLLVVAACRDSWCDALGALDNIQAICRTFHELDTAEQRRLLDGLMRVWKLPVELKQPIEAKACLVDFLFETAPRTTPAEATAICDALLGSARLSADPLCPAESLRGAAAALLKGLDRFDAETLWLRQRTGLDQWLSPALVSLEAAEQVRDLISALQDDSECGGLARIARALMAVVHLPRAVSEPEELPMGGFSDISNRGPFDRLLVSELAHDNLTLAVRVCLNEALYLRREAPPKTPPRGRFLLIDSGIRLWGTARVFAAAVAMALAATGQRNARTATYRAQGRRIAQVDLASRKGLVEHLAALTVDPHPGQALGPFFEVAGKRSLDRDCVVITSAQAAADRRFLRDLAGHNARGLFLATVDPSGQFQLTHFGRGGQKVLSTARLDLEELLKPRSRPTVPLIEAGSDVPLPAIFRLASFPLRVPANNFAAERSWAVPAIGLLEMTEDGRLLLWDRAGWGPRQIAKIPSGKSAVCWGDPECRDGKVTAVLQGRGSPTTWQLLKADIATGEVKRFPLNVDSPLPYFAGHGGAVFAISRSHVQVFNGTDGSRLASPSTFIRSLQSLRCFDRRFFISADGMECFALTFDGHGARFKKVWSFAPSSQPSQLSLIYMFDAAGHEGPIGITLNGEFYYPHDKRLQRFAPGMPRPFVLEAVSSSGRWLLIQDCSGPSRYQIDFANSSEYAPCHIDIQRLEASPWVRPMAGLMKRFHGILFGPEGLTLVGQKGWRRSLRLDRGSLQWRQHRGPATEDAIRPFRPTKIRGLGCQLHYAAWDDGSRAYLDSRGLLHLKSSDPKIPEVSLVLDLEEAAGWCSDGRFFGKASYIGDARNAGADEVLRDAILPFCDRLR